ncbi:formate dehydrogenase-H [Klebsiella michiganensis]|uniref:Formate dehydrogenase-H n=1 Tax=Klebsiella michiganensis TaxID=1134687 RepID=A0A7H4MWV8_9ENTR|nr:formate dehydrogenase-H [Klebsiella michiganensis]
MTYQWWIGACNELVTENLSPITKTPEYKYCAVNVERIADQRPPNGTSVRNTAS